MANNYSVCEYVFHPSCKIKLNKPNDYMMISQYYDHHYNTKSSIIQLNLDMSQDIHEIKIIRKVKGHAKMLHFNKLN